MNQPKLVTVNLDAGTIALLLDGLSQLPLARSLQTFNTLRELYRQNFEAPLVEPGVPETPPPAADPTV